MTTPIRGEASIRTPQDVLAIALSAKELHDAIASATPEEDTSMEYDEFRDQQDFEAQND